MFKHIIMICFYLLHIEIYVLERYYSRITVNWQSFFVNVKVDGNLTVLVWMNLCQTFICITEWLNHFILFLQRKRKAAMESTTAHLLKKMKNRVWKWQISFTVVWRTNDQCQTQILLLDICTGWCIRPHTTCETVSYQNSFTCGARCASLFHIG